MANRRTYNTINNNQHIQLSNSSKLHSYQTLDFSSSKRQKKTQQNKFLHRFSQLPFQQKKRLPVYPRQKSKLK
jgi:hypothetical protein